MKVGKKSDNIFFGGNKYMKQNSKIETIIQILEKTYPDAHCSLDFETPFELLVAVVLSAQCTDARVNQTTPALFQKYNTPQAMANMKLSTLEQIIHPCGFYHNKAKNLKACATKIVADFDGKVPSNMDDLTSLPGVGRKSANVILLNAFHKPVGIAIDTHAKRICNRLGLTKSKDPLKIEQDLLQIVPSSAIASINHLLVYHGRKYCTAKSPQCSACPLQALCPYAKKLPV